MTAVWIFAALVLILAALWTLIPALYGLPTAPTSRDRIRAALRLADLRAGEVFFDLGAGDGRALVIAAGEFGAHAIGVEIGPLQCLVSWWNARRSGVRRKVKVKRGNFYRADVRAADAVFIYATSRELRRLQTHLESQLRAGARVVTAGSDFPDWTPDKTDRANLLFLYVMPPQHKRAF